MAQTTFNGPVKSINGFINPPVLTAALPLPASVPVGTTMLISDNGPGNDTFTLVVNNGTAWVTALGTPLS